MNPQRRLEILLEENILMTGFKERDFKKIEQQFEEEKKCYHQALAEVRPARESVMEALGSIGRSEIHEIGTFVKPPKQVETLCHCLAGLRGQDDEGWAALHAQMTDLSFMRHLRELDMDALTSKQTNTVKGFLKQLSHTDMARVCSAGIGLLKYVEAVLVYCDGAKKTQLNQKKEKLAAAQERFNQKKRELEKMQKERNTLETALADMDGQTAGNNNNS